MSYSSIVRGTAVVRVQTRSMIFTMCGVSPFTLRTHTCTACSATRACSAQLLEAVHTQNVVYTSTHNDIPHVIMYTYTSLTWSELLQQLYQALH